MKIYRIVAALAPLALAVQPASAAPLLYTITGSYAASFTLDDHPVAGADASAPNYFFPDSTDPDVFYIANVAGTFGGHAGIGGLTFYSAAALGGLTITFLNPDTNIYDTVNLTGIQLFKGPVDAPTLITFGPAAFDDYDTPGARSYVAQAVPEPASWAMLAVGLGVVGAAMRRRRTVRVAFA
ncbi:MAG: PEP-CTERM sorting domain-containing protein [Sphingobium sp.]|nr:PEP-CTERM sorting domain-containing protein [Sphingobium sp.]